MKSIVLAWLLAAGVAVAGCAPESGQVTGKGYSPAHTSITTSCVWINGKCRWTSIPQYEPESFWLTLRNAGDEGDRAVPQVAWTRCQVGSRYPDCVGPETRSDWS